MKNKKEKKRFTHLDAAGQVRMVDVGGKPVSLREAVAEAVVLARRETIALIRDKKIPKGDVLTTAKIAGILAAKKTHELIPMCHPLPLEHAEVTFQLNDDNIVVKAAARTAAKTGVEMEALTAAAVAALTIYDMCKSADRAMSITGIKLLEKKGGASGHYKIESIVHRRRTTEVCAQ